MCMLIYSDNIINRETAATTPFGLVPNANHLITKTLQAK